MIVESDQQRGESRSACLMLPPLVLERLRQAKELGDVMDEVFGTENIKQKAEPLAFNPPPSHPQHSLSSGLNSRSDPFINQNIIHQLSEYELKLSFTSTHRVLQKHSA